MTFIRSLHSLKTNQVTIDALEIPDNKVSRWSGQDLGVDNSSVTTLVDRWPAGHNLTDQGTGCLVNVASDGVKEWEFFGASYFQPAADYAEYDIDPTTSNLTCVLVAGEIPFESGFFDQLIGKGTTTTNELNGTWGLRTTGAPLVRVYSNGVTSATNITPPGNTIEVFIIEVNSGTVRLYISSTTVASTITPGAGTNNNLLTVGARINGSSILGAGSMREIAIYSDILSSAEKQAIFNQYVVA